MSANALSSANFHPAVSAWFANNFAQPTAVQTQSWPAIARGEHTLLAAPTGSGKTLAAFLASIDALIKEGLERGGLPDETRVLYISPLKALSNDIQKNLQLPLAGIRDQLLEHGLHDVNIKAWVRTGDTPQSERQRAAKTPPHIVVTTPESAYILLSSQSGRDMLATVRTVIVDEIHALAGSKRGSHLCLSLERLEALTPHRLTRVGCSATQKPIETMAHFLVGQRDEPCTIIDTGHVRDRDLALEVTSSPLQAIMPNEVWEEVYDRLTELINTHNTTLIFVNTRRLAERAARHLSERIGEENVTSHHGSLAKEHRLKAEKRLKAGDLKCLVATASLELGIDIGDIDLVCQMGSPKSIAAFLQRVGRSGHAVNAQPKGRLFPLSRDDLVECMALLHAAEHGELDRVVIPAQPLDVLAQHIVAEVAGREEWSEAALFEQFRHAWPYRDLTQEQYSKIIRMLASGFSTRRGRRGAYLHHDAVNGRLRARKGARLTAITNGGAIPDQFDYEVNLLPEGIRVGTLNEDFAFESMPGDIFQLGNTAYRMLKIEMGKVYVEDAKGLPPTLPFWFGEAPGRTNELSYAVSRLRLQVDEQLEQGMEVAAEWLLREYKAPPAAGEQLLHYLASAKAALTVIPSQQNIVFERFFDATGDMHLIIHSPFGSRVNRAWGLSLRKRFCRKFNFELQAAALEDSIILSLSATHSFPLDEPISYLKSATVSDVLVQALLDSPMFPTRWRWVASIALAVRRNHNGKRAPAYFQRNDAEDLVAVLFPDQLACAENVTGRREVPDHPLVQQAIADCLHEVMDLDGFLALLRGLEAGEIQLTCKDLNGPSPLSQEILGAKPFAFLDDAPAEERRALAVQSRDYLDPGDAAELGRLDNDAINRVKQEAWPEPTNADELHDALVVLGFVTEAEGQRGSLSHAEETAVTFGWQHLFDALQLEHRATRLGNSNGALWVAAERLGELELLYPDLHVVPPIKAVAAQAEVIDNSGDALREIVRSRLEGLGPTTAEQLTQPLAVEASAVDGALIALELEGFVVRGQFTDRGGAPTAEQGKQEEWCERRLLARIHRYTIKRLRSEIEPVAPTDYMRFLFLWHGLTEKRQGPEALAAAVDQLEGFSAPAGAWERDILSARIAHFSPGMLDALCTSGKALWLRLHPRISKGEKRTSPVRNTPIALVGRQFSAHWRSVSPALDPASINLTHSAQRARSMLQQHGASFFTDMLHHTGLLKIQLEDALGELVNWGMVTADTYAGLRALVTPANKRGSALRSSRKPRGTATAFDHAGRWSLLASDQTIDKEASLEHIARTLLLRYGIVFRKVLERETGLPPWRDLLRVYWRMEARGEIRGGRFVQGFAGEQFALADAVAELRNVRKKKAGSEMQAISAADPLNLVGLILPGDKIAAQLNARLVFRDGVLIAKQTKGIIQIVDRIHTELEPAARALLTRNYQPTRNLRQTEIDSASLAG